MRSYKITKYDPRFKENENYIKNQWTDFSDIGNVFNGKILTEDEYVTVENRYITCILDIMKEARIEKLYIDSFEIYSNTIWKNNKKVLIDVLPNLIKDILRNKCWCKLNTSDFFVHFGYDYYMYIGTKISDEFVKRTCERHKLFCVEQSSPYNDIK